MYKQTLLTLLVKSALAPLWSRRRTTSICPSLDAMWSGVSPAYSDHYTMTNVYN